MSPLIVHTNIPAEMPLTIAAAAHGGMQSTVTRLVLHDEEYLVGPDSAEQIAAYFASSAPGTSAHYVVDANSVQHCVLESVVAYHAPPNAGSIGIEHDGFAHFDAASWALPGSAATLQRSAELAAGICARWGIPVRFLAADDLRADRNARGITFHSQVSLAFGESTHMDPGTAFPIDAYLANVKVAMAAFDPTLPAPPEGDDMPKVVIDAPGRPKALLERSSDGHLARVFSDAEWRAFYRVFSQGKVPGGLANIVIETRPVAEYDALTGFKSGA